MNEEQKKLLVDSAMKFINLVAKKHEDHILNGSYVRFDDEEVPYVLIKEGHNDDAEHFVQATNAEGVSYVMSADNDTGTRLYFEICTPTPANSSQSIS